MTGAMEYPDGATPLDPDELGGLKFKHITTREELDELEQANRVPDCDGSPGKRAMC